MIFSRLLNADGVLVIGNAAIRIIDRLVAAGVQPVLITNDRQDIQVNSVCSDDFAAGILAAKYLIDHGLKRIGFLCGSSHLNSFMLRRSGAMVQTIESLGIENFETRTAATSDDDDVARCFREWLQSGHCPEGIITSHDSAAAVVCRELKSAGFSCPEDFSLVAFDNSPSNAFGINITHLQVYPRQLGIKAALRLFQIMNSEGKDNCPYKIAIPLELVEGESVKRL